MLNMAWSLYTIHSNHEKRKITADVFTFLQCCNKSHSHRVVLALQVCGLSQPNSPDLPSSCMRSPLFQLAEVGLQPVTIIHWLTVGSKESKLTRLQQSV